MRKLFLIVVFLLPSGFAAANPVPTPLVDIETLLVKTFDLALKSETSQTYQNSINLSHAWAKFKIQAAQDGAKTSTIQMMDNLISNLLKTLDKTTDKILIATVVNEPSSVLAELFSIYRPTYPTDLLTLSYIDRQFILAGSTNSFQDAEDENASAELIWNGISAQIAGKGNAGVTLAYDYENSLLGIEKDAGSTDGPALVKEARKGLLLLHAMKGL